MNSNENLKDTIQDTLAVEVRNTDAILGTASGSQCVEFKYKKEYAVGDVIRITLPAGMRYLVAQVDSELPESLVYLPEGVMEYNVPCGDQLLAYPPKAFRGLNHCIKARLAGESEVLSYRNLALNSMDYRDNERFFPHAKANFVNTDHPCLEARNAIDGCVENHKHGYYPYQSWSGGKRDDLEFLLDFGRNIEIDKVVLFLRAEFENGHDTFWKSMIIQFSNGSSLPIELEKTNHPQTFSFPKKTISWLRLEKLVQPSLPLGFAALTEIEIYGKNIC
jgi:hypothetical protein